MFEQMLKSVLFQTGEMPMLSAAYPPEPNAGFV